MLSRRIYREKKKMLAWQLNNSTNTGDEVLTKISRKTKAGTNAKLTDSRNDDCQILI